MSGTEAIRGQSTISADRSRISNPAFFRRPPGGSGINALTPNSQKGFTYLGILIVVMVMGAGLAATGTLWSTTAQREKERELLFIGNEFRQAIESYYRRSPGAPVYPKSLAELVDDKRFPMPQHHLRRIYADPMTGKNEWELVEAPGGGGIMGVRSRSESAPLKTGNFRNADAAFEEAKKYSDWQFVFVPKTPSAPSPQR
jgi:type II secretory pathway pseudopilin PulG